MNTNFIISKALFEVAQPKQNKKVLLLLLNLSCNNFTIKYPFLNMNRYVKLSLLGWFFKSIVTRLYSLSPNFQTDNIVEN